MYRGTKIRQEQISHQKQCEQEDGEATCSNYKHKKSNQPKILYPTAVSSPSEGKTKPFSPRKTKAKRIYYQQTHTTRNVQKSPSGEMTPDGNKNQHHRMKRPEW